VKKKKIISLVVALSIFVQSNIFALTFTSFKNNNTFSQKITKQINIFPALLKKIKEILPKKIGKQTAIYAGGATVITLLIIALLYMIQKYNSKKPDDPTRGALLLEINKLKNRIWKLRDFKVKSETLETEVATLKESKHLAELKIQNLQNQLVQKIKQVRTAKEKSLKLKEILHNTTGEDNVKISSLETQISELAKENEIAQQKITRLKKEIEKQDTIIDKAEKKVIKLENEIDEYDQDNLDLGIKNENLQTKNSQYHEEIVKLKEQIAQKNQNSLIKADKTQENNKTQIRESTFSQEIDKYIQSFKEEEEEETKFKKTFSMISELSDEGSPLPKKKTIRLAIGESSSEEDSEEESSSDSEDSSCDEYFNDEGDTTSDTTYSSTASSAQDSPIAQIKKN